MFKCKHPFYALAVEKEHTARSENTDYEIISYNLYCRKCGTKLKLKHTHLLGGVKEFLARPLNAEIKETN